MATQKQQRFRELIAEGKTARDAYKDAYGKDNPAQASRMARQYPAQSVRDIVVARKSYVEKMAKDLGEVHALESRQGRIKLLCSIADGTLEIEDIAITKEGDVIRFDRTPNFRERDSAVKELGKIHGDHVIQIDANIKGETKHTTHVVHVANGRGPAPAGPALLLKSVMDELDVCPHCNQCIEHEMFTEHENKCPDRVDAEEGIN